MKYRMTTRLERPVHQAIAYSLYSLIFIALALLNRETWITLLCAFLCAVAAFKAMTLFASVIFDRDEFKEETLTLRITRPRS